MTKYPDIKQAIILWQDCLSKFINWAPQYLMRDFIFHTNGIAVAAHKIAENCGLDAQKAYVLGLLHDYGKLEDEKATGYPHFLLGYDKMMELGYFSVAKICLSHSFPFQNFDLKDYTSYSIENLIKAKDLLKNVVYDDYDRLIQLCDILFEGINIVKYEKRILNIRQRYNLTEEQTKNLELGAKQNKEYFDNKCGCDIYKILNI